MRKGAKGGRPRAASRSHLRSSRNRSLLDAPLVYRSLKLPHSSSRYPSCVLCFAPTQRCLPPYLRFCACGKHCWGGKTWKKRRGFLFSEPSGGHKKRKKTRQPAQRTELSVNGAFPRARYGSWPAEPSPYLSLAYSFVSIAKLSLADIQKNIRFHHGLDSPHHSSVLTVLFSSLSSPLARARVVHTHLFFFLPGDRAGEASSGWRRRRADGGWRGCLQRHLCGARERAHLRVGAGSRQKRAAALQEPPAYAREYVSLFFFARTPSLSILCWHPSFPPRFFLQKRRKRKAETIRFGTRSRCIDAPLSIIARSLAYRLTSPSSHPTLSPR